MSAASPADAERGAPLARRIGLAVGPLCFVALLVLPGIPLDGQQRRVAAVTALTATLWITVALPVGATSLLPVALFPLLGVMPASEAAPLYMTHLVLLFVGAFVIALGLERWGVHRRMALWIIARVGSSPAGLVLGFMAASAFLSLWINNTATTLLMLPIAGAVILRVEEERGTSAGFATALFLGVAYASSVGGMGTPVGTAPNQEFLGQFERRFPDGPRIGFGRWILGWGPLVVLFVPLGWWILTRMVFRVSRETTTGSQVIAEERRRQGRMSPAQRRMSAVFAATALLWVTRADLRLGGLEVEGWARRWMRWTGSEERAGWITDSTVASLMAVLCFVLLGEGGKPLMDWRTARRLPWDVLLLLGAGFCLAQGFRVSRLDEALGAGLAPWLADRPGWVVVPIVVAFMSLLTEVTSNTATTAVLLPVIASAGVAAGINPLLVMVPATIAASSAFMMPVATPPNAVVFSSRRVALPDMARAGLWLNLLMVLLITAVFHLWVRPLWGIEEGLPEWVAGG